MSRRAFVGTVAAGLPLLAGAGAAGLGQSSATGLHDHTTAPPPDAVVDHVTRQLAHIYTRTRQRGLRAEDLRAFAAQARVLQVYRGHTGAEARLRSYVAAAVETRGLDAVLYIDADRATLARELKTVGLDMAPDEIPSLASIGHATRTAALDEVRQRGVAGVLEAVIAALERGATQLEMRAGHDAVTLVSRQSCPLDEASKYMMWMAMLTCGMAAVWPILGPECLAFVILAIALEAWMLYYCGWP